MIRKQKRRILIDESTGDKDKLQTDQIRLARYREKYKRFSEAAGLPTQHERAEVAGFTWKHGKAAEKAAKESRGQAVTKKVSPKTTANQAVERPVKSSLAQPQNAKNYADITDRWYPDEKPNSYAVKDLQEVVIDGVTYKVDGRTVQLSYTPHEREIAELLAREVGGEVFMVPRVNYPQGVSTPDYIFNGKEYDLKTIGETTGKNPIVNRIKNAKIQAKNFIFDVTNSTLSDEEIDA